MACHSIRRMGAPGLALSLFLAAPTSAQEAPPAAGSCVPHGNIARIVEMPERLVYATLETRDRKSGALTMYLATLLQEIVFAFVAPDSTIPLPSYSFTMLLHKDGRLTDVQPVESYIPSSLAEATIRAIDSTSKLGGIGPVFLEMETDPLPLQMVFRLNDRKRETNVPFYQMRFPAYFEYETDKPALVARGSPSPRYPPELRELNIEGEVLLQLVVDTMGRADMSTLRLLGPPRVYREFVRAVFDVIPKMRFLPAERRGCKVKQLIHLPFAFKLNR